MSNEGKVNKSFLVITQFDNGEMEVSVDGDLSIRELGDEKDVTSMVAVALKLLACDKEFPKLLEKVMGEVNSQQEVVQ